jgi:hypothetical protein
MTVGEPSSVCMTQLSCTLVPDPMRTPAMSPRTVALNQTEAPEAISTSPMTLAVGATHASGATTGRFPRKAYRGTPEW